MCRHVPSRRQVTSLSLMLLSQVIIIIIIEKKRKEKKRKEKKRKHKTNVIRMTTNPIMLERSPFHKQRDETAPKGSMNLQTQVSKDVEDDFMRFAVFYNIEHHPPTPPDKLKEVLTKKANPLKHIINEFLNSHALERKCFKDLHVIMAFNNPFDYHKRKFAVIGFVRHPEKFTKFRLFNVSMQRLYETGLVYALEEFNKEFYDMLNLASFDREVLFDISPSLYGDFEEVKKRLQELHADIDFENAYFVMFNINNYLDILQDGVYNSEMSKDKHDGAIVLCDPDYEIEMLCVRISWSYHDNKLDFKFNVEDEGFFRFELAQKLPLDVYNEFWSISTGFKQADISKLEMDLKSSKLRVETLKESIEIEERRQARIERKLDELKL